MFAYLNGKKFARFSSVSLTRSDQSDCNAH